MTKKKKSYLVQYGIILFFLTLTVVLIVRDYTTGDETTGPDAPGNIHIDNMDKSEKAKEFPTAIDIVNPSGFINTDDFLIEDQIGEKVVLVDFWTFSCINCQRTLPYLNQWHEKYYDKGLVIVGIHTPEFEFEEDYANVQEAVEKYEIKYPVVLDNDYSTWRAYKNRYWPRKYLIDIDGFIVYDHIGEGAYEETEMKIQELLEERSGKLGENQDINQDIEKPENAEDVDFGRSRSPETYFGALRNHNLGNGRPTATGAQAFQLPGSLKTDLLYLSGNWDIQPEFAENLFEGSKIVFKYQAQKVFLVASSDEGVEVEVFRDGNKLEEAAGSDLSDDSTLTIQNEQLYRLIEDDKHGEHVLEIIVKGKGLKAFAFTFG